MSKSWRFTTYHDYKDGDKEASDDGGSCRSSSCDDSGSGVKKVDGKRPSPDKLNELHRKTEKESLVGSSSHKHEDKDRHKHKKHKHHRSHKKCKRKSKSRSRSRDGERKRSTSRSRSHERREESHEKNRRHYRDRDRDHRDDDRSYKQDKRPSHHQFRSPQSRGSDDYDYRGSHSSSTSSRGGFRDNRGRVERTYVDDRLKTNPGAANASNPNKSLVGSAATLKTVPVEAVKLKEEIEKRKLLWSKKEKPAEATVPVAWKQTAFSDDKASEKFRRLMGMKDGGNFVGPANKPADSPEKSATAALNQDEYFANLERQYEVARATTHTQRGLGLGFSARKHI